MAIEPILIPHFFGMFDLNIGANRVAFSWSGLIITIAISILAIIIILKFGQYLLPAIGLGKVV